MPIIKTKVMKEIIAQDWLALDGKGYKVKATTEKAILLIVNRGHYIPDYVNVWLPRSAFQVTKVVKYGDGSREVQCRDLPRWAMNKIKGY